MVKQLHSEKMENTADFRGVRHMHWLSKLSYRMCYLCFHVEDFGDKGIRASFTAHEAICPTRRCEERNSEVERCPESPLDRVPQQNLVLAALHQQRALSHNRQSAPDPHALLNAQNANFKVFRSDELKVEKLHPTPLLRWCMMSVIEEDVDLDDV
jgi:hypothetical protein